MIGSGDPRRPGRWVSADLPDLLRRRPSKTPEWTEAVYTHVTCVICVRIYIYIYIITYIYIYIYRERERDVYMV